MRHAWYSGLHEMLQELRAAVCGKVDYMAISERGGGGRATMDGQLGIRILLTCRSNCVT